MIKTRIKMNHPQDTFLGRKSEDPRQTISLKSLPIVLTSTQLSSHGNAPR